METAEQLMARNVVDGAAEYRAAMFHSVLAIASGQAFGQTSQGGTQPRQLPLRILRGRPIFFGARIRSSFVP